MSNNILFVFEGEKTEKQIIDNLTKYFVNDDENRKSFQNLKFWKL